MSGYVFFEKKTQSQWYKGIILAAYQTRPFIFIRIMIDKEDSCLLAHRG